MAKTLLEQLISVQTAIEAVLTSQSYKMAGKEMTRADLDVLYAREDRLEEKISKYGPNYIPGVETKKRRGPTVKKGVFKC